MSKEPKYKFFVDGTKYDHELSSISGAEIRARASVPAEFGLFQEGHGNDPDKQINNDTTVSLEKEHGPPKLFTVPPATFGGA